MAAFVRYCCEMQHTNPVANKVLSSCAVASNNQQLQQKAAQQPAWKALAVVVMAALIP